MLVRIEKRGARTEQLWRHFTPQPGGCAPLDKPSCAGHSGRVMAKAKTESLIPIERVASRIYLFRGRKVIFDSDLAELYAVETKALNQAVSRNLI